MILHLGVIELLKFESGTEHDSNRVETTVEDTSGFESDPLLKSRSRVKIASDENELHENGLQLRRVRVDDLVLLKSFEAAERASGIIASVIALAARDSAWVLLITCSSLTLDKVDFIGVDDASILAANPEVVGYQIYGPLVRRGHARFPRATEHGPSSPTLAPTTRVELVMVRTMVVLLSFHLETIYDMPSGVFS